MIEYFKSGNAAPLYPDESTISDFVPDKEGEEYFLVQDFFLRQLGRAL